MSITIEQSVLITPTLGYSSLVGTEFMSHSGLKEDLSEPLINKKMDRHCNECGFIGDAMQFFGRANQRGPATRISDYRSTCKKCRSKRVARQQLEKKIQLHPNLYIDCDVCDYIFRKSRGQCPQCIKGEV